MDNYVKAYIVNILTLKFTTSHLTIRRSTSSKRFKKIKYLDSRGADFQLCLPDEEPEQYDFETRDAAS